MQKELMKLGNPKMGEEVSMRTKLNETLSAKAGKPGMQKYGSLEKLILKCELYPSQLNVR